MQRYSHTFNTDYLMQDLKRKSVSAWFSTTAAGVITQILRVGSIVILARLLLPEHFGLVSMVTVLTAVAERFKDFGLSTATIQQKDITHEQASTLFWINASTGMLIAMAVAGLAPVLASFYGQPRLVAITMVLSLSFACGGLTVQHQALLRRQMRFWELACIQVLANFLSVLCAIGLAVAGFTYWALVWKEVARAVCEVCGTWLACHWRPGLPAPHAGIGPLLRIGRDVFGVNLIHFAARSVDHILVGKFAGVYSLGLYKQAYQLITLPTSQLINPIGYVAPATLSVLQHQPDTYQRYYKKILAMLAFVSIPLMTYLAIFSEDIIWLVLGKQWVEAAGIFRIMAIAALIEPLSCTCILVMITLGKTKRCFWWAVMHSAFLVLGFSIGIQWGTIGVAAGYTVAHYALVVPSLWFSFRDTPVSVKLFCQAISMPAFFSIIMAAILILLSYGTTALHSTFRIGLSALIGLIAYFCLWMIHPSSRKHVFDNASYLFSGFKLVLSVGSPREQ